MGARRPEPAVQGSARGHRESEDLRLLHPSFSSTVEATGDEERELIGLTATVPFDDRFHHTAKVSDLSASLMADFLHEVGSRLAEDATYMSVEELGRQLNVVGGPPEAPLPKNVGLMFFNEDPRQFFPATQIDVVYFPEGAGGDRFEEKVFVGPLARITRDAISFIGRNYLKEIVIKHADRPEAERVWNFPLPAIEEAVVNAVYHRSYEIREPVEVRITAENLSVLSFPGPDRSIKMEDLRAGRAVSRRYRNRRIGELLKELELTEGRSTGISKILRVMAANGSPPPELETDDDRTYFLVRLPVRGAAGERADRRQGPAATPQATPQVTPQVARLVAVSNGELSRDELQARLGLADREHFRRLYLRPAIDQGLVEMTAPDAPRSCRQRYRLTAKGRRWRDASQPAASPRPSGSPP